MDITVDITGRKANLTEENWHHFWSMGDINRDGYINITDYDLWVAAIESGIYDPDADLNQDGIVDVSDYAIWWRNNGLNIWTYFHAGTHQRHLDLTSYTPGWSQTYGGTDDDRAYSVIKTSDGGYALAGYTDSYGSNGDFWLVKTDWTGGIQWNKNYGGAGMDVARSVVQTSDGGYALAGYTYSYGTPAGKSDFWLVKTNSAGTEQWRNNYGGEDQEIAYSVVQTSDGGYALAGYTASITAGTNFTLVKTNSAGTEQWKKTYGGVNIDIARSVVQTSDGGYALAGHTLSYGTPGFYDFWLVKTNSTGSQQWANNYGEAMDDYCYSLVETSDGGYALAGYTYSYAAGDDFLVVKTNSIGTEQWRNNYGDFWDQNCYGVVQTSDGGYALAGHSGYDEDTDFWLVKTNSIGNMQWNRTYGGVSAGRCYAGLVQTSDGGYALAGYTYPYPPPLPVIYDDFWLVFSGVESGLAWTDSTSNTITLYRGRTDPYWNYVRVRIWTIKEPTWMFGDINQDGIVDAQDLYIVSRNYGKTFSLLSLTGIIAVAGIHTYKKRKRPK